MMAHAITGVSVHDARLVATMKTHGVAHLLTLNDLTSALRRGHCLDT